MCGIAGICKLDGGPVDAECLQRMTDVIAHRGPDGEGHYVDEAVGLGHRRLAIIDLSELGRQPMLNASETLVIVYNGEIYNFRELRAELEALGCEFRSRTDSEVALYAYEQWGEHCVDRFNGMFAFAIWDLRKRHLFLARDRYGIKPLYYWFRDGTFIFASEIKAIIQHPNVKVTVDPDALLEYFTFQNIFTDRTLFGGVKLLPAGCTAILSLREPGFEVREYWDYCFEETDEVTDIREYEEQLHQLFEQAVQRQLVSDVPVGAYLSGGMDSGAITAVASRQIARMSSFTAGFDLSSASGLEMSFDERPRAERLSYKFNTEHYEIVMKAGDMEHVMRDLIWHLEDLRVGQCYPNYYVARLASKFSKVVLAGTGADELFGGYPWRYYRAVNNRDFDDYVSKYYRYWHRLVPNEVIHRLFKPHIWEQVKDHLTIDIFRGVLNHGANSMRTPEEYVNHSLYLESKTFLHGLFIVEDKLSMAHGLETRVPFLDNDLVDFAMRLPVRTKLRDLDEVIRIDENEPGSKPDKFLHKTNDGKILLRRVLGRYMADDYVSGTKQGFSAPDASWFRGDSLDYVQKLILSDNARIYDFLERDIVHDLVGEHLSGKQNRRLFIWSLLSFEWWLRIFLN